MLVNPEIPGNTGNIGRLCAGANVWLHLVEPLGFELDNRYLRRAGLDYWPHVRLTVHPDLDTALAPFPRDRVHVFTAKATHRYDDVSYTPGSVLVFGRETKGLDADVREAWADRTRKIPITDKVRSLNLSNACAIALYEAMRQNAWTPLNAQW
jgi:tRNA (cytidine/uridine-2'-O-)-methyltransferase